MIVYGQITFFHKIFDFFISDIFSIFGLNAKQNLGKHSNIEPKTKKNKENIAKSKSAEGAKPLWEGSIALWDG